MKSANEIKIELERQKELKQLKILNELLEWVEMCVARQIQAGQNGIRIFEWDRDIGLHFDKIKPILEGKGYKVCKKEEIKETFSFFNGTTKHIDSYIVIEWE